MSDTRYVLDGATPGESSSQAAWATRGGPTDQYVAVTSVNDGQSPTTVTSRFIGFDPSPRTTGRLRPFVTTIFGGPLSGKCWRGATWQAALLHHAAAVRQVGHALASKLDFVSALPPADEAPRSQPSSSRSKKVGAELSAADRRQPCVIGQNLPASSGSRGLFPRPPSEASEESCASPAVHRNAPY